MKTLVTRRSGHRICVAQARNGFTLMEVLLALVLCGVVLSAAFSAVHLSWKYRSAGTRQVEHSQIARGVLQDITLDLRSVARQPHGLTTAERLSDVDGLTPEMVAVFQNLAEREQPDFEGLSDIEEQVLQFDSLGLATPVHFYGQNNFFVLLSDSRNHRFTGTSGLADQPSLLQHVVWFSNSGQPARIPFNVSNGQLMFETVGPESHQEGLLRVAQSFDARQSERSNRTRAAVWTPVVPDQTQASFRYSNGADWQKSWNSLEAGRCPIAVEITLDSGQVNAPYGQRFVVHLPQINAPVH